MEEGKREKGRVLLVGMVGAIVLTLQVGTRRKKVEGKRQHVSEQWSREEEEAVRRVEKERKGKGGKKG